MKLLGAAKTRPSHLILPFAVVLFFSPFYPAISSSFDLLLSPLSPEPAIGQTDETLPSLEVSDLKNEIKLGFFAVAPNQSHC